MSYTPKTTDNQDDHLNDPDNDPDNKPVARLVVAPDGGPLWIRTTDLGLIRTAL